MDATDGGSGPEVLLPGDAAYDEARRVWNAMVDHRPAVVVRCRDTTDVVAALARARRDGLEVGVRCGGHSVVGHGVPDGGLMIDLTPMGAVRVDPVRRRAWVQGGALLGALDAATQPYGLATTAGNVSHTGVGGLTLGGGMGWLARQYGLTCDNVVSFEVVTAAGEVVRASADERPELFWALRGGGGNFGVVTEFELRLHETGTRALSVELDFPVAGAAATVARWRDLAEGAPRAATYTAGVFDGVLTLGLVWVGDPDDGRTHGEVLDALGEPVARRVAELSYLELQSREDSERGHAVRRYWKGHYLRELSAGAIDALLATEPGTHAGLQAYGGAIADVPDADAAFGQRQTAFEYVAATGWTDPGEDDARVGAARASAARMAPYASGVYVNALSDDGAAGVRRAYPPEKLARLAAVKAAYDPGNVFHLNQNIEPAAR
ncbi:FAD-binding oxidoreductase [Promicromonospora thailandica]|uniref:FAD/FMN-containing dehydrogenase n=1 Tax=Promicromonospora thailandica TaxID=765201 RepID=A0A9X2JXG6_9MICO|nr:FAD-binding oxidoreductase [Promicromonospora thailandica]MCP2266537.1 FAD/FMN-containing dehydrogenase [Promicromonospora thailandica]BFF17391.1 FAD-binding oxidoreductase [Promicromonospora thailandica]